MMQSDLACYPLAWIFLVLVMLLCRQLWRSGKSTSAVPKPPEPSEHLNHLRASLGSPIATCAIRKVGLNRRRPAHHHPV
jgi:hypothetical protein